MINVKDGRIQVSYKKKANDKQEIIDSIKADIAPIVIEAAEKAVKEIPAPENGKDGASVTVEDVLPEILAKITSEVSKIPKPKNGKNGLKGKDGKNIKGQKGEKGDTGDKGDPGEGVPDGGDAGEVLTKLSHKDFDTGWRKPRAAQSEGAGSLRLVKTVSGLNTDNSDPYNPVVNISVDGVSITGSGTPGDPLVSVGGGGGGVLSLNTLTGNVTLSAGSNIVLTPTGNDIEISATGAVDSVNGQTGIVVLDTGDIAEVTDKNYVTDSDLTTLSNTSGVNTGDQTSIVGITGTKAEFDTACTDGNFLYVGDVTQYTDELAQDAIGAMVDSTLVYVDGTPLLTRGAITGDISIPQASNTSTLATVNANVGTFGSATASATLTVNAKGLITAISNTTIQHQSTGAGITAAGTNQATATQLASTNVPAFFTVTSVNAGEGVKLPTGNVTRGWVGIKNSGANPLNVYSTSVSQTINGMAATAAFVIPVGGSMFFLCASTTTWFTAPSFQNGDVNTADNDGSLQIAAGVIVNADINASAAIDATKIGDGSVTSTEFQFINTLSSNAQTQIDGKQPLDATLTSLAAYNTNGLLTQTAADTFTGRTITGPAAGISVSNGNGVSGNPTLALANDLSALEGLGSTGIAVRSASDTWVQRSIAVTSSTGLSVSNGDGVSGNPTLAGIDASTSVKGVASFDSDHFTVSSGAVSLTSQMETRSVEIEAFTDLQDVTTGDGKKRLMMPSSVNGMNLVRATASVGTAGTTGATTIMIHNLTQAADMLSGAISIASGGTIATAGTVDTANDDVATDDILRIDVDSVSTTPPKGLCVVLEFRLP